MDEYNPDLQRDVRNIVGMMLSHVIFFRDQIELVFLGSGESHHTRETAVAVARLTVSEDGTSLDVCQSEDVTDGVGLLLKLPWRYCTSSRLVPGFLQIGFDNGMIVETRYGPTDFEPICIKGHDGKGTEFGLDFMWYPG
jgi:hypothetical protein